jgi:PE family
MLVDPALLGVAASSETAGTAAMGAASAAAAPAISGVVPPGADSVSVRASAALVARGAETTAILAQYVTMRGLFAGAIASSGGTYSAVETINASTAALG